MAVIEAALEAIARSVAASPGANLPSGGGEEVRWCANPKCGKRMASFGANPNAYCFPCQDNHGLSRPLKSDRNHPHQPAVITDEMRQEMVRMWDEGMSKAKISAALGISQQPVNQYLASVGRGGCQPDQNNTKCKEAMSKTIERECKEKAALADGPQQNETRKTIVQEASDHANSR